MRYLLVTAVIVLSVVVPFAAYAWYAQDAYYSQASYGPPPGIPGTPTYSNVTQTAMRVSWTAATNATNYVLFRCTGTSCTPTTQLSESNPALFFNVTGLAANTTYRYRVIGYGSGGYGPYSAISQQTTLPNVPGAPGTPTFSSVTAATMRVSWTAASGAVSYKVERCAGSGCSNYSQIATGVTTLYFDDSSLANSTIYRYRVRATNTGGDGTYSGTGQQATPDGLPGAPGTPTFTSVTATTMRVNWTAGTNATSYKVERCSGAGCSNFSEIATGVASLFLDVSTLTANTSYSFRVRGTNGYGNSSYSGTGTQTTTAAPPTCSMSVTPQGVMEGQSTTLTWVSSNATGGTIDNGVGAVGTAGSLVIVPTAGQYIGTFTGPGGSIQCSTLPINVTPCSNTPNSGNVRGFAWSGGGSPDAQGDSGGIGWISFNSTDDTCTPTSYGVSIDEDGNMEGHAWSENIGWIQFGNLGDDPSDFPSGPGTVSSDAKMAGNALQGWARALAYSDTEAGGWDGWISLSGTGYGPTLSNGTFSGYAWGDDVLGWIDFNTAHSEVVTMFAPCEPSPQTQCLSLTTWDDACTPTIPEVNTCAAGLICSEGASSCVIPADANGELTLSPALVPTGNTTEVSWSVEDTESCRVYSDASPADDEAGGASGSFTSLPINETTLFTLECDDLLGETTSIVDTAYAVVVPTWIER